MIQVRRLLGNMISIRLVIAFIIGLFIGLIVGKIGTDFQNAVPYLFFPCIIGIAGAFSISNRNPHPYRAAIGTGLLAWAGISIFLLITAAQDTSSLCAGGNCSASTDAHHSALLLVYLLGGLLPVTLTALITGALIKWYRLQHSKYD